MEKVIQSDIDNFIKQYYRESSGYNHINGAVNQIKETYEEYNPKAEYMTHEEFGNHLKSLGYQCDAECVFKLHRRSKRLFRELFNLANKDLKGF